MLKIIFSNICVNYFQLGVVELQSVNLVKILYLKFIFCIRYLLFIRIYRKFKSRRKTCIDS